MAPPTNGDENDASVAFPDGSITKIIFEDFLTYEYMEIYPGPNLNVIIGPNGTGKSTVICGLCLALGGTPKVLGRSEKLSDYIRYGRNVGGVTVVVRDSGRETDRVFSVVLHKIPSTEYFIDGQKTTQKELRQVVAQYNIQLDNPCTFLAQDKVKSFAAQNPRNLLENTEKALDPELVRLHQTVWEIRLQSEERGNKLEELEKRLNEIKNELQKLAPIVENYRRRETMRERIQLLKNKELYMECLAAMAVVEERMQNLQAKQHELTDVKKSMLPIENDIKRQKEITSQRKQYTKEAKNELHSLRDKTEKLLRVESVNDLLMLAKRDYDRAKKEHDEWESNLNTTRMERNHLEEKLAVADRELTSFKEENAALKKEYLQWNAKEEELDRRKSALNNTLAEINFERRAVNEMINAEQQSLRKKFVVMEGNGREMRCGDAWMWYESHKEQFRHPVFVPILFMTLPSEDTAKYLENIVPKRDLLMFIFRCKEDELLLTDKKHPWKINSCILSDDEVAKFCKDEKIPMHLRSLGFSCMATHLYTAPDPVKAYLNSVSRLQMIPIGSVETENRLDEVCEALKNSYRLFLTNSSRVQITVSRYSGNLSVRTDTLNTSLRFLIAHTASRKSGSYNPETMEKKLADIRKRDNEVQIARERFANEEKEIAQGRESCRTKMDAFIKKKAARNIIANQLRAKTARLQAIENDKPDLNSAVKALNDANKNIIDEAFERIERIATYMGRSKSLIQNVFFASMEVNMAMKKLESLTERMRHFTVEYERKADEVRHMEESVNMAQKRVTECKERFHEATGISIFTEDELSKDGKIALKKLQEEFDQNNLPNVFDELQLEIAREQSKLEALHSEGEKKDIERFEKLTNENETVRKEAAIVKSYVDDWENRLIRALEQWLHPLEKAIERINYYFSTFFEKLGCVGEVHLQKPDSKFSVADYGIVIRAKFRDGERLRQLTHQVQSGGERSLSTMLYILALQELTAVPFRCVDEINQGMDPTNEKRVFDMIVSMLSGDIGLAKTQYFLLTPKLVPDLTYSRKVKIHCIYSGMKLEKRGNWNVREFLAGMRTVRPGRSSQ